MKLPRGRAGHTRLDERLRARLIIGESDAAFGVKNLHGAA